MRGPPALVDEAVSVHQAMTGPGRFRAAEILELPKENDRLIELLPDRPMTATEIFAYLSGCRIGELNLHAGVIHKLSLGLNLMALHKMIEREDHSPHSPTFCKIYCSFCGDTEEVCSKSRRPCGHHCEHCRPHDACCWCGAISGEDGFSAS